MKLTKQFLYLIGLSFFLFSTACKTVNKTIPDPQRFAPEMAKIKAKQFDNQKDRIVFTGSSSVRFWLNLSEYYPKHQIINTGFGGSQMSDLLYYLDDAVLRFVPNKVFIYEGDNDIFAKQSISTIMKNTKSVVQKIEKQYPNCEVILISAKPSIARWNLKTEYEALNVAFKDYAAKKKNRSFANVWDIMLDEEGEVLKDIFIQDGLHMNKEGYALWDKIIHPFMK